MDKKEFNKITKDTFLQYGFVKEDNIYVLYLPEVSIGVKLCSWRGVRYFSYMLSINNIYNETSLKFKERRTHNRLVPKIEHSPHLQGYHSHEITYEKYSKEEYTSMLSFMLHHTFDPFKEDALGYLKKKEDDFLFTEAALDFLGL